MFFGFGNQRHKIRAWERALFEGKRDSHSMPNIPLYERLTEVQILNDCRIISDCARIIAASTDKVTVRQRRRLATERYKHLMKLKPFAAPIQSALIKETVSAYRRLNQPDKTP